MVPEFDECGVSPNLGIALSVKNDCAHFLGSVCHERNVSIGGRRRWQHVGGRQE